jgi:DNA polymerase-1
VASAKTLLLIDGNNLFHRAYHALPVLTDKSGQNTNAVYGFSNMILKAISEVKPAYIACAFDTKAPTFRHVEFEAYKAQRAAPPPDLYPQFPIVKQVLDAFDVKYFEKAGYEADDLLATLAMGLLKKVDLVIILSGDRDVLQLVNGKIKVQMPGWNLKETTLYGASEVKEKFGLEPHQMVDYKSLTGDPSDNVPGVSGIGPKTAAQLLQQYHTLENLYDHLDEIPETTRGKLEKDKDVALAAKKLVELDTKVDVKFKLSDLEFEPDWKLVRAEYERLGFKSIVAKLPGGEVTKSSKDNVSNVGKTKDTNQLELI